MRRTPLRLLLLTVIVTATVGAGIFDIAFSDVIPARPYTHTFLFTPVWMLIGRSESVMSDVMIISLVIILVSVLIRVVANQTTGIVIAHTGFTPNNNLTSTPGLTSVVQLFPLFFAFLGLGIAAVYFRKYEGGV